MRMRRAFHPKGDKFMALASENPTIARCGSVTLEQAGRLLLIIDRGADWTHTARFVLGLLAVICSANTIVFAATAGLRSASFLLAPLAALFVAGFIAVGRYRAKRATAAGTRLVTIDLDRGLLNDRGEVVAPLAALSLHRTFQLTSSSKAVELRWPSGAIEIARGSPFAGDVSAIENALHQRGIGAR